MTVDQFDSDTSDNSITIGGGEAFEASFDFDSEPSPSSSVVRALEEATGTYALELPPLHAAIDPEALDAFVTSATTTASVAFDYGTLRVSVSGEGDISVTERGES